MSESTAHFQEKANIPEIKSGDRIRVHQKIKEGGKERVQVFEGLVIKTRGGQGINGSFTIRKIALGVGVEKTYPLHLPSIVKIEKLKSAKTRRAKLYFVRGLVGKKARRLKREKDDAKVWENVVVEEVKKDPEQKVIENEAEMEKPTDTKETVSNKAAKTEESKAVENQTKQQSEKPAEK